MKNTELNDQDLDNIVGGSTNANLKDCITNFPGLGPCITIEVLGPVSRGSWTMEATEAKLKPLATGEKKNFPIDIFTSNGQRIRCTFADLAQLYES